MRLFIAEKPSVARALAAELGPVIRADGYLSCGPQTRVTWCFGHILELAMPKVYNAAWTEWRIEDLPLRPTTWKLVPRKGAKQQLAVIGRLLREATEVVHAGDPDREGQLLVDEVLEHFGWTKPVQRFWVSAQDPVSLQRGLKSLRENRAYRGLHDAALARSRADWLVGINLTRAYTLRGRAREAGHGLQSVGRVQTPTLSLVVARDRVIAAFRPVPFFSIVAQVSHAKGSFQASWRPRKDQPRLDAEGRLLDAAIASAIAAKVSGRPGVLVEHRQEKRQESPPKAFTLTRLTLEASNRWGYTAEQVLDACQALYETHKLASYPRTDCEYLPESQHADAPRILAALKQVNPSLAPLIDGADPQIRSATWNDARVGAHHGIIPTMHVGDPSALAEAERNVYGLIVRSYLAQFYPAHEYLHTAAVAQIAGEDFTASGRLVTQVGWRAVVAAAPSADVQEDNEEAKQSLPPMQQGDAVRCERADRKDKKTTPPKCFTEGTLQVAMEKIYLVVGDPEDRRILKDEDGIGTVATRPMIISELKRRGFLRTSGKHLVSTDTGQRLIDSLPARLTSPSLTALYERALKEIEAGREELGAFLKRQDEFVAAEVAAAKTGVPAPMAQPPGPTCPACHRGVLRRIARRDQKGHFWGCSRYRAGCGAIFPDRDGQPVLEVPPPAQKNAAAGPCPKCGKGQLRRIARNDGSGYFWGCDRFRQGCKATFQDVAGAPAFPPTVSPPPAAKRRAGVSSKKGAQR